MSTIDITRTFDATPEDVFTAWTQADQFAAWFGSVPERTTVDATVGGKWQAIMEYEGAELTFFGEFQEVTPHSKLVLTFSDSPEGTGLVTVTLDEVDGGTKMRMVQDAPLPEEQIGPATEGWNHFLDAMGELLAKQK